MHPDEFRGHPVFVVGSGPSLTGFDFSQLEGKKVIAVNHAYKITPHQVHTFYDQSFLSEAEKDGYNPRTHTAHILAGKPTGLEPSDHISVYTRAAYVSSDPRYLFIRYSSTQAAVNYALIMGASAVYLLGVDCKFLTPDEVRKCAEINGNPSAADEVLKGMDFAHHVTQQTTPHTMNEPSRVTKYIPAAAQYSVFAGRNVFNCSPCSLLPLPYRNFQAISKSSSNLDLV